MPWEARTAMSERVAFCCKAQEAGVNFSALCSEYAISRKTGYKWLQRYEAGGSAGLIERSRRPQSSPRQTPAAMEEAVVALRQAHPAWGGRKLAHVLQRQGLSGVPSASTITVILRRNELLDPTESLKHRPCQRFERESPNQLWQMDFKGHFTQIDQVRCHPLTVLDDHSRYLVGLQACGNEKRQTVQERLTALFRAYGLPDEMLADNGSPWGVGPALIGSRTQQQDENDDEHAADADKRKLHTQLTVWLLRYDVPVIHGRPRHPQTQGKDERLHRTLKEELLVRNTFVNLADTQRTFDQWRTLYNQERPHEALGMAVPAARYRPSLRPFPERLAPIVYDAGVAVRIIDAAGCLNFANRKWRVGKAFRHELLAVQPTALDGVFSVRFGSHQIRTIDLSVSP